MKRKKELSKAEILNRILEGRLGMPSVRRYLELNKIKPTRSFIESLEFKEKLYNTWPEFKKKDFLITMAGVEWETMQQLIEKK